MTRRSLRSPFIDYQHGVFFVTIVAARRASVFGSVNSTGVDLAPLGELVEASMLAIPEHGEAEVDELIVMPNHVHVIVALLGSALGNVIGGVKSHVTNAGRRQGLCCLEKPLWQRGYHDHRIRSESELERARQYIRENPERWHAKRR